MLKEGYTAKDVATMKEFYLRDEQSLQDLPSEDPRRN